MVATPLTPESVASRRIPTFSCCGGKLPESKKDGLFILSNYTMSTESVTTLASESKDEISCEPPCYRVEVTIDSLENLETSDFRISGALVAFGGCSRRNNLQVGSSVVCNQTGHLLVESEYAAGERRSISWTAVEQPHMSMYVSNNTQVPGSFSERQQVTTPEKEEHTLDLAIAMTRSHTDATGSTAGWSLLSVANDIDSHLDNVVEVLLRLQQAPCAQRSEAAVASCWDGVAYLIIPSQPGRHEVIVPVQIPKTSTLPRSPSSSVACSTSKASPLQNAILHVSIHVFPTTEEYLTEESMLSSRFSPHYSQTHLPNIFDGEMKEETHLVLDLFRETEGRPMQDFQIQRRHVLNNSRTPKLVDQSLFGFWGEVLCQGCDLVQGWVKPHDDDMDTDSSTIITRASLGI